MYAGGTLVLKMILEIFVDVNDSTLRSLTQSLYTLCMKDIPGENMGTVMSYLKGVLLLLQNCSDLPTRIMGLLTKIIYSSNFNNSSSYMRLIYFTHKWLINYNKVAYFIGYLNKTESESRTLYRKVKWTSSKFSPASGFYFNSNNIGKGGKSSCIFFVL